MSHTIRWILAVLFVPLGLVSLLMAFKSFFSRGFLPFHEKAVGRRWDEVDHGLQHVVTALKQSTGLGFAVVGLQLVVFPFLDFVKSDPLLLRSVGFSSFLFCAGLAFVNYRLKERTGAATPWLGSLFAAGAILAAIIASFVIP